MLPWARAMRRPYAICLILFAAFAIQAYPQERAPLRLVQTIPMPGVQGRLDHLGADIKGKRLFVAALGDSQNTVEVVDLKSSKRVFSIPGQRKPQGVFYSPTFHRLFVANGTDGSCKIFRGDDFKLIDSLTIGADADHVGYDPATKYLYVGVGDAKSGALSVIDTRTHQHVGDIKTDARPGGIKIEQSRPLIFVTLAGSTKLGVVDRKKREEVLTWPVTGVQDNVALALDEIHHRLFAGTRNPPRLTVLDTESGKPITQLDAVPGIDDLWYDATHERVYASGGRGFEGGSVYVYQQKDTDHYELLAKVPTAPGAGTSLWVPQFDRYYVAAPAGEKREAAVLIFEPE
jgi:DNA-binding beta-propeller fold protein YncE